MIPKIIHQLWIGPKPPPTNLMNTWKTKHESHGFQYIRWTEEELKKRNFTSQVQPIIDDMIEINGKADILRWEILYEYGGVYLDIDVITLKSFESLIDYDCCLSGEKYINDHIKFSSNINDFSSITNAIIICKKKNKFIKKWLEMTESEYMSNDIWAWHAVLLPLEILKNNNYNIHIEPVESFIPFNFRCHDILSDNKPIDLNKSYCFHLWETIWNDYLKSYTENSNNNTNLGNIISDILTIK